LIALHPELRDRMGEAAIRVARSAGYYNAGTVEFLVDRENEFYFLEMNTRLQVEHPVTELVTGLDLVKLQIRIAAGEPLAITQPHVSWRGVAIESRIYAEDPDNQYMPSPGTITRLDQPSGPGVRLDSGVYEGWTVPIDYDPLLAKLIVWAGTREEAIGRMIRALREFYVAGIKTNVGFFRQIFEDANFRDGKLHTGFLDAWTPNVTDLPPLEGIAALVAAVHSQSHKDTAAAGSPGASLWLVEGRGELLR
jgi:acetyl-CoA carboxylase biotin carboxylase subunit